MGTRRVGRRWVREESINRVIVSVSRGGGESGYGNNDNEGGVENVGGYAMERKYGTIEGEEGQEGSVVKDQTDKILDAY